MRENISTARAKQKSSYSVGQPGENGTILVHEKKMHHKQPGPLWCFSVFYFMLPFFVCSSNPFLSVNPPRTRPQLHHA